MIRPRIISNVVFRWQWLGSVLSPVWSGCPRFVIVNQNLLLIFFSFLLLIDGSLRFYVYTAGRCQIVVPLSRRFLWWGSVVMVDMQVIISRFELLCRFRLANWRVFWHFHIYNAQPLTWNIGFFIPLPWALIFYEYLVYTCMQIAVFFYARCWFSVSLFLQEDPWSSVQSV